jgi:hypothetical protein
MFTITKKNTVQTIINGYWREKVGRKRLSLHLFIYLFIDL